LETYQSTITAAQQDLDHLQRDISQMKQQIAAVFDYFGEDPNKKATDFFQTLTSFCMVRY
jgi:hypothetical protein